MAMSASSVSAKRKWLRSSVVTRRVKELRRSLSSTSPEIRHQVQAMWSLEQRTVGCVFGISRRCACGLHCNTRWVTSLCYSLGCSSLIILPY